MPLPALKSRAETPGERFCLDGLPFELVRKPIRHMYLRVKPDGATLVSAPVSLPLPEIMRMARTRLDWVRRCLGRRPAPFDPMRLQPVWGRLLHVRFEKAPRARFETGENTLAAWLPRKPEPEAWQALLNAWHKLLVEARAPALLARWRGRLGLGPVAFGVRSMKRRWGTCYPGANKIILASQLATKPPLCLEYVITHELLHFTWPNHGREFKTALARCWPQWRQLDQLLDGGS